MTSGNVSDEPIAYRDEDALERLGAIADLSSSTTARSTSAPTTRSSARWPRRRDRRRCSCAARAATCRPASACRSTAPRHVLACGAELKNTFCLAKGGRAWVGHHIGDLRNFETLRSFTEGIEHFERLFAVEPGIVAHDLHPDYLSTQYALEREGVELVGVQHHHAHLAACLAEHGETGPGGGRDLRRHRATGPTAPSGAASSWSADLARLRARRPTCVPRACPAASRGDPRAVADGLRRGWSRPARASPACPRRSPGRRRRATGATAPRLVEQELGSPETTSMGRLFDAVGALCGAAPRVSYEGQAAVELEAMADPGERRRLRDPVSATASSTRSRPFAPCSPISMARSRQAASRPASTTASRPRPLPRCSELAAEHGTEIVVLSGGVFQNRLLLERTVGLLAAAACESWSPSAFPQTTEESASARLPSRPLAVPSADAGSADLSL